MDVIQRYLKETENRNSTQKQTVQLIIKARQGDQQAKNELIENYLRHVVTIARQYMNIGVLLEDLIQEGNMGLMIAIDKYDLENGAPFGSYSKFWIKQSIIRNCMHKRRLVRLPENISELLRTDRWKGGEDYKEFSIDLPFEDGGSLSEKLPDDEKMKFIADEESMLISKKVENILSFLKNRDAEVVKAHFGIGYEKPMDIEEIAELFSLTTTRINQILRISLKTLREFQETPIRKDLIHIISATYGTNEISIDVTRKVTEMINNKECVKSCNKLAGDPCKGIAKFLFIEYVLDKKTFNKKVSEGSYIKF